MLPWLHHAIFTIDFRQKRELLRHKEEDESVLMAKLEDSKYFLMTALENYSLCLKCGVSLVVHN